MARRDFYTTTAWIKCRDAYIKSVCGLCERCGQPGYIVHHKIRLTAENEDDPNVTLNWDNLEYLCLKCHNEEHFSQKNTRNGTKFDANGQLVEG